jgi:hypothetical protein
MKIKKHSMKKLIHSKNFTTIIVSAAALVCFELLPKAQAVSPAPDGGYAGNNTAEGTNALFSLTSGIDNAGLGFQALFHNTTGNFNTAEGFRALFSTTSGALNTANGTNALSGNTTGNFNTADGVNTLFHNTTGASNTAIGVQALFSNTTAPNNTATGSQALFSNSGGTQNTANGVGALFSNTTGSENAACGANALLSSTTGGGNTAIGFDALHNNTTGVTNTAVGFNAGFAITTADNVVVIGTNVGGENVDHSCFIGEIFGATSSNGTAVFINSDGRLGTATSSRRFKEAIKPMEQASEALFALKPVTFRYKKGIDPQGTPQFGLVAEEVEKVDPALVVRDKEGKPYSVRYDQVNTMLLNEFLKEHRKVEKQQATIAALKSTVAQQRKDFEVTATEQQKEIQALIASVKEQASQIQKVSAQLEASNPAPQVVNNP